MLRRLALLAPAALFLAGCGTRYVSVPEYHTEYRVRTDSVVRSDTVRLRDSVFVSLETRGDTVYVSRVVTKWRDRVSLRQASGTDNVTRADSVRVPAPVERRLTKAERRYVTLGKFAVGFIVCGVVFVAAVWWYRRKA